MQPTGLYLAVCDETSTFNTTTLFADAWTAAKSVGPNRLWAFNSFLAAEMSAEQAISWVLILWGTYRLRVRIHDNADTMPFKAIAFPLIDQVSEAVLACPTGRIGWVDVEASKWHPLCTVAKGRYLARITGTDNPDHWHLDPASYPRDGSDWELHLLPVAGSRLRHRKLAQRSV
jgi:hypothetical protein